MTPSPEPPEPAEGPLVSVCIPTYNRAGMVGDAIRSALAQTYKNIEVLIVDNASTDGTTTVVSLFTDPPLRYVRNDRNLGLFGNCNRCIELSRGKYLHILHSDDTVPPEFIHACVRFLEEHPEVAFTFTDTTIFSQGSEVRSPRADGDVIFFPPEGFRKILRERSFIACPSVLVRKKVYQEVGGFSLEYPYSSDLYQWLKISRVYPIAYVHGTSLRYLQSHQSESYRLLFLSPQGYLDTLKILVQVIGDLGEERGSFKDDVNAAAGRLARDSLYAFWTRAGGMKGYSPDILAGIALTSSSLMEPPPTGAILRKWAWYLAVAGAILLRRVPGVASLVSRMIRRTVTLY